MTALAFGFTKLVVQDIEKAERFYREVFGMKTRHRVVTEEHQYALTEVILSLPDSDHALILCHYLHRPCPTAGAAWTGFVVTDLIATLHAIERLGGRIDVPVHDNAEHGVRAAIAADPDGHLIEIIQRLPPES